MVISLTAVSSRAAVYERCEPDRVAHIALLARIIQLIDPAVAQIGVLADWIALLPLPGHASSSPAAGREGLRVDGGWMSGASRPACHVTRRGIRASA
jgi:hypothetical protein